MLPPNSSFSMLIEPGLEMAQPIINDSEKKYVCPTGVSKQYNRVTLKNGSPEVSTYLVTRNIKHEGGGK